MRTILGIDPGLDGGLAIASDDGILMEVMPRQGNVIDVAGLASWLRAHKEGIDMAYLEQVGAMPKQGVSSTFKFGRTFGNIEGVLAALGIPYQLVPPARWMKSMFQGIEGSVEGKNRGRLAVSRLFPQTDFKATARSRVAHDGMVDAVLIAEWGRRQDGKGTQA